MPVYIATVWPPVWLRDQVGGGGLGRPTVVRAEAESEGQFVARIRDWWISRYGVDAEPEIGKVSLSRKQK